MKIDKKTIRIPGRLLAGVLAGLAMLLSAPVHAAVLKDISYTTLPDNRVEVRLHFDGEPPESSSYSIEQPARVALDLMGTQNEVADRHHELRSDFARSATLVEAQGRTRLIVNLDQSMGYDTYTEDNDLVLVLGGAPEDDPVFEAEPTMVEEDVEVDRPDDRHRIRDVDFRRGEAGEGQVQVQLSRSAIPVDVREVGGRIRVRFVGTELPDELMRRMDVGDFGTPIRYVDTRRDGDNVEMTIHPEGEWEYMAYQADQRFSVNVRPVDDDEEDPREEFQYTGEELSLNFQDIEVRSVLQLLADFTGMNLVASDTVTGNITLRLQNVPWDQALDLILRTKGLDKRQEGNVLMVAPADELAAREQQELESRRQREQLAPLRSEYIRINYARAQDMESIIREEGSILSDRGSITVDERTNTLIVQDTERHLEEIRDVIRTLDIAVQQVLIEARVVVATSDLANELGVRWGGLAWQDRLAEDGRTLVGTGRAQQITEFGVGVLNQDDIEIESPDELAVDMGVTDSEASRFSLGFVDVRSGILELELSALAAEGHGEVVATPKVLTADQQPAVIASGTQIGYEEATAGGATAVTFIEAELRMEVTPRITPDGRVIMELNVHNDSVGQVIAGIPSIDTNRVETTVLVDDGETVVLGGIFQQEKLEGEVKTPFLGDLPWIGRLFRRTFQEEDKQELLVFITPRLVQDGEALASN